MFSDSLETKTLKKVNDMKIYVLAATSALLFVGGIRLICEMLVMIQAA